MRILNSVFLGAFLAAIIALCVASLPAFPNHGFSGQVCTYNEATKHEDCPVYSLFPFLLIEIGKALNDYGAAITAIGTGFIAWFTFTLWKSSEKLWSASEVQINIAKRALTELEAPFLSVNIVDAGLVKRQIPPPGHEFVILKYDFMNFGRTPANLVELVDTTVLVLENGGLPPEIDLQRRTRNTMPRGVIAPPNGESQPFVINLLAAHMNELAEAGANNYPLLAKYAIFFYGFVTYETIFKETFRMGFCFVYDRFSDRWLLSGGERYNYLQREG